MLTLYHAPDSRSSRFIWLLEEMRLAYDLVYCDLARRRGGAPDPRNRHPEKRVPALAHDDLIVTEQAAIALYLTDTFPRCGLGIAPGESGRAEYLGGSPSTRGKSIRSTWSGRSTGSGLTR